METKRIEAGHYEVFHCGARVAVVYHDRRREYVGRGNRATYRNAAQWVVVFPNRKLEGLATKRAALKMVEKSLEEK